MRLKHVKNADIIVNNSPYVVKDNYKGNFNKLFNNNNPIYIEIGMGKGNFIINNAINYPNINFIGIEKYDSVLIRAVQKLEDKNLKNLKLIRMDANKIDEFFDHEIDLIYLNFSDPWPKDRHEKRRLSSPNFLKKYDQIFKNDKHIIMKTDNRKLFEYSLKIFNNESYRIEDISLDLHKDNYPFNIETEYEEKFSKQGIPIYMVNVKK